MNKKENYETFRHTTHYLIISSFYMDDKKDFDIFETFCQYHTCEFDFLSQTIIRQNISK